MSKTDRHVLMYKGLAQEPFGNLSKDERPSRPEEIGGRQRCCQRTSKKFLIVLAALLIAKLAVASAIAIFFLKNSPKCPSEYVMFKTGFCYKTHTEMATFTKASEACQLEDAFLVSIHSAIENDFVRKFANDVISETKFVSVDHDRVWIGLALVNWRWEWTDGSEKNYLDWMTAVGWMTAESINKRKWASLMIDGNSTEIAAGGTWRREGSDQKNMFVCKRKPL